MVPQKLLSILSLLFALMLAACSSELEFSSDLWKSLPEQDRYKLVDSLMEKDLFKDKSKLEIVELLGPPSYEGQDILNYVVRHTGESFFSFSAVTFIDIRFSRDGVVQTYSIRDD